MLDNPSSQPIDGTVERRLPRWPFAVGSVLMALAIFSVVLWNIELPYLAWSPGPTPEVVDLLTVEGCGEAIPLVVLAYFHDFDPGKDRLFSPGQAENLVQIFHEEGVDSGGTAFQWKGEPGFDPLGIRHEVEERAPTLFEGLTQGPPAAPDADVRFVVEIGIGHVPVEPPFNNLRTGSNNIVDLPVMA